MLCHTAGAGGARSGRKRCWRPRIDRRVARPATRCERVDDWRGMERMVDETLRDMRLEGELFRGTLSFNARSTALRFGPYGGGRELELYRSDVAQAFSGALNEAGLDNHLPLVRPSSNRNDAGRRLPVLLRMQGVRRALKAEVRGLLRVLFLWRRSMPANSGSKKAWPPHRMLLRVISKTCA
jgi:hypothetical protein